MHQLVKSRKTSPSLIDVQREKTSHNASEPAKWADQFLCVPISLGFGVVVYIRKLHVKLAYTSV